MKTWSKPVELLLKAVALDPLTKGEFNRAPLLEIYASGDAAMLLPAGIMFERGLDLEEEELKRSGDKEKAFRLAEPYYSAAAMKRHAKANYRFALNCGGYHSEFVYAGYIERAAARGYMPAVRDYYRYYEEFRAKTIMRDSWRRKLRQEKIYRRCCSLLALRGDLDAMWDWGTCLVDGVGGKKEIEKGMAIRDGVLKAMDPDDPSLSYRQRRQESDREWKRTPKEERAYTRRLIRETLFPGRKNEDVSEEKND